MPLQFENFKASDFFLVLGGPLFPADYLRLLPGSLAVVGIVKAIEAHPGKPALGPPQPQYVRALGAALFTCRLQQEGVASC
jgi:hypothetical protein